MHQKNPFAEADHIQEPPTDLRERILRSAMDRRGWMAMAGLFTGSYLGSIFRLTGGKPDGELRKKDKGADNEK